MSSELKNEMHEIESEVAIKVENISKCYHIYDKPHNRLKQMIVPRLQRLIGKLPAQYYREFWALKDVSFEVKKGETIGIIGRNGSGKSTLLQIICGTLNPTAGKIQTNGRVAALLELGSGFNPEFTGRENIYLNASVLGLNSAEIDARFDEIVSFADIGDFIEQPVKTYSSGMYVRLAFAVIAHVDADILVVDEALAVGDAFFTQKCMRYLREFMKKGTVLFVSHDTASIQNLCSRAIWLGDGHVLENGTPKAVSESYLRALFSVQQEVDKASEIIEKNAVFKVSSQLFADQRMNFINSSCLRNDIEVFEFSRNCSSFGAGGAQIVDVSLLDEDGNQLAWVVGGERIVLRVEVSVGVDLSSPIIGFSVKDRLGQPLFGDNTWLTYINDPIACCPGDSLIASFKFEMPRLPCGDYSIGVAIANGSQQEHVQHHWMHDALCVKSVSTSVAAGLIGIPMQQISIDRVSKFAS